MAKRLNIPKSKKTSGLRHFCKVCRGEVGTTNICKLSGNPLKTCVNSDRHVFRSVVYEPNTGVRRIKVHETQNIDEAIKENALFKDLVKKGKFREQVIKTVKENVEVEKRLSMLQAITFYLAHLDANRGAEHTLKQRSKSHRVDCQKSFLILAESLKGRGVNIEEVDVKMFSQEYVGFYHSLLKQRYSPRTYNRHVGNMRAMFNYLNKHEGYSILNPFNSVQKLKAVTNPKSVETSYIKKLFDVITPEAGVQILSNGVKKYHYHVWIKDSILAGILLGLRREELCMARFSHIETYPDGVSVLRSSNLKVNRITNAEQTGDFKVTHVPLTAQALSLLSSLGYEEYKKTGEDKYILAGDSKLNRITIMNQMSKAFGHYAKIAGLPKDISFKHLRKGFATKATIALGQSSHFATGHSSQRTLENHYIDKREVIAKMANDQTIFSELDDLTSRTRELKEIRDNKDKQISRDIDINN